MFYQLGKSKVGPYDDFYGYVGKRPYFLYPSPYRVNTVEYPPGYTPHCAESGLLWPPGPSANNIIIYMSTVQNSTLPYNEYTVQYSTVQYNEYTVQ